MRFLLLISALVLLGSTSDLYGQDHIIIYGKVYDSDSLSALPGTSVYSSELGIGTTSNLEGEYELSVPVSDVKIKTSYIGYATQIINIEKSKLAGADSLYLNIALVSNVEMLPWTYVEAEYRTSIFEDKTEAVLDFEFYNEYILLLLSGIGYHRILLLNNDLKELSTLVLNEKPRTFYKDCFDGVHLIYRKHIDELQIIEEVVSVKKSHPMNAYHQFLKPCIASSSNQIFFEHFDQNRLSMSYYARDLNNGDSSLICIIKDEENLKSVIEFREELKRLIDEMQLAKHDRSRTYNELRRTVSQYQWFERMILSRADYNPLFEAYDQAYVFNHLKGKLIAFDKIGNAIREVPIDYHINEAWNKSIHQDHVKGSFYIEFEEKGVVTLLHFDPNTGKTKYSLKISDHAYPEKLKVRNGQAWYIHQGPGERAPVLYRMDLLN